MHPIPCQLTARKKEKETQFYRYPVRNIYAVKNNYEKGKSRESNEENQSQKKIVDLKQKKILNSKHKRDDPGSSSIGLTNVGMNTRLRKTPPRFEKEKPNQPKPLI